MGKHKHSKDRMFITYSEMKSDWCGKKDVEHIPMAKLPFNCCGLSMLPFENPVCTIDGTIFDIINIIPFIKKYKTNPISGQPLKITELIRLNFAKNDKGEYIDPVSFKVFTDFTKIVAIKPSGNVFCFDTVEELNKKPKYFKDLVSGENFTFKDIIVLQDPTDLNKRTVKDFDFVKNKLSIQMKTVDMNNDFFISQNQSGKSILDKLESSKVEGKGKTETEYHETIQKKVKMDDDINSTNYFVQERINKKDLVHDLQTIKEVSVSVTSTAFDATSQNSYRTLDATEIRKIMYDKIKKSEKKSYVALVTNLGEINLELHSDLCPKTVENFVELCEKKFYNGVKFHRLVHGFCLQGGDPTGTGKGGESIFGDTFEDEIVDTLKHFKQGLISMANKGSNTNTSQLYVNFITLNECSHLDGKHTIFGQMIGGSCYLDTISKIQVNNDSRPQRDIVIKETKVLINPYREFIKEYRELVKKQQSKDNKKDFKLNLNEATDLLKNVFEQKKEVEQEENQGLAASLLADCW